MAVLLLPPDTNTAENGLFGAAITWQKRLESISG